MSDSLLAEVQACCRNVQAWARAEEREACAKIVESLLSRDTEVSLLLEAARQIRARTIVIEED